MAAICRFLVEFQVGLALQVSDGRLAKWSKIVSSLQGDRVRVFEALERRDAVAAQEAVSRYYRNAIEIISGFGVSAIRLSETEVKKIASTLIEGNAL